MKKIGLLMILAFATSSVLAAQAPAGAPAGATGLCNDGTYYTGATKRGACRGHKGVKDWYAAATDKTKEAAPAAAGAAPAPAGGAATAAVPAPAKAAKPAKDAEKTTAMSTAAPAAGGGAGQVWVNHPTKVYHCNGDRYYGKTKAGEYMTEADAAAKGYRPDHGKTCK